MSRTITTTVTSLKLALARTDLDRDGEVSRLEVDAAQKARLLTKPEATLLRLARQADVDDVSQLGQVLDVFGSLAQMADVSASVDMTGDGVLSAAEARRLAPQLELLQGSLFSPTAVLDAFVEASRPTRRR